MLPCNACYRLPGDDAFSNSLDLASLSFAPRPRRTDQAGLAKGGVPSLDIGAGAFAMSPKLRSVTIPGQQNER